MDGHLSLPGGVAVLQFSRPKCVHFLFPRAILLILISLTRVCSSVGSF